MQACMKSMQVGFALESGVFLKLSTYIYDKAD